MTFRSKKNKAPVKINEVSGVCSPAHSLTGMAVSPMQNFAGNPISSGVTFSWDDPVYAEMNGYARKIAEGGKKQMLMSMGSHNKYEREMAKYFSDFLKGVNDVEKKNSKS